MPDNDLSQGFLYIDLQGLMPGKPFAGFAAGTFEDMLGREIILKADDIKDFVKNTLALIAEYKARKMPGLPIDARKHDKGDAAGWITGAEPGEVQNSKGEAIPIIRLMAEWTKIGVDLIRDKIMTNFSPTVDLNNKVIRGGSLTNWPATVDQNDVPLFSAVELSQGIFGIRSADMSEPIIESVDTGQDLETAVEPATVAPQPETAGNGDESMTVELSALSDEQRAQLFEDAKKSVLADLAPGEGATADAAIERLRKELNVSAFADVADLSKAREALLSQAKEALESEYRRMQNSMGGMLAEMMKGIKTEQHIAELSQKWTGGTEQRPHGFPVGREEVEAFLGSLNEGQRQGAESILGRIFEQGLIRFSELGHGRQIRNLQQVPADIAPLLKEAIDRGVTADEFFLTAGLGSADQYDLSKYEGGK